MDKAEAIAVLREIYSVCPQIGNADFVSLDYFTVNSKGFFRIRLRVSLDDQSRIEIQPVLDAHKLEMRRARDLVDIYPLASE